MLTDVAEDFETLRQGAVPEHNSKPSEERALREPEDQRENMHIATPIEPSQGYQIKHGHHKAESCERRRVHRLPVQLGIRNQQRVARVAMLSCAWGFKRKDLCFADCC